MQRTLVLVLAGLLTVPVHLFAQGSQEGVVHPSDESTVQAPVPGEALTVSVLIEAWDRNRFRIQMDQIARFTQKFGSGDDGSQQTKNPYLACGLSALLPGMGQFYNGQIGKGALHLALLLGSFVAAGEYRGIPEEVGLAGMFGTYIWSMIDAPVTANAINQGRVRVSVGQSNRVPVGSGPGRSFGLGGIEVGLSVGVPNF